MSGPSDQRPLRLAARDLAWSVGERFVLLDVAIALHAGSLTVLWGDNGAGKSTLLDMLAGLRAPTRGVVSLDGVPIDDVHPAELARRLARVGHKPGAFLDLTAHENVQLATSLCLRTPSSAEVTACLDRVGLERRDHHRPVRGFSRGMLQRTALARLLLTGADVWLLDEPSTGLDAAGMQVLAAVIAQARDRGASIVVATHDFGWLPAPDQWLRVSRGQLSEAQP